MYDGHICTYLHPSVALAPEEAYTLFVNSLKSGKHMHPYDHSTIYIVLAIQYYYCEWVVIIYAVFVIVYPFSCG